MRVCVALRLPHQSKVSDLPSLLPLLSPTRAILDLACTISHSRCLARTVSLALSRSHCLTRAILLCHLPLISPLGRLPPWAISPAPSRLRHLKQPSPALPPVLPPAPPPAASVLSPPPWAVSPTPPPARSRAVSPRAVCPCCLERAVSRQPLRRPSQGSPRPCHLECAILRQLSRDGSSRRLFSRQPSPIAAPVPPPRCLPPGPSRPCRLKCAISRWLSRDGPLEAALARAASCAASHAVSHMHCPCCRLLCAREIISYYCVCYIVEYNSKKNIIHTKNKRKKKKQDGTCQNEKTLTYPYGLQCTHGVLWTPRCYGYGFHGYGSRLDLTNLCQTM